MAAVLPEPPSGKAAPPVGYLELLRENADYRRLWLAEVASFCGDWFNTIAMFTAVGRLSGSTQAIAAVFVAKMLPIFAVSPIAGPLIDRFDRRRLLVVTDLARALCAVGLVVAYRLDSLHGLIALQVVMMCFAGVFIPAKSAVVPQITTTTQLGAANALSSATWSSMLALGAALGGLATGLVGIEFALVCDGLTFLVSAAFLIRLPVLRAARSSSPSAKRNRGFIAGLRYLGRRPYLTAVISLKPLLVLSGGAAVLLPLFATRVFPATVGAAYMGLLYSARGVGALIGSLALRKIFGDAPRTMRRLVLVGYAVIAISWWGLARAQSIWQAALIFLVAAVGNGIVWVFSTTLGHLASADEYRGRVFSVEWGALTLVLSAVAWVVGWGVDHRGWTVQAVCQGSALVLVLPMALWTVLLARIRQGLARQERERLAVPPDDQTTAEQDEQVLRWRERWLGQERTPL